jgi:hypothetical protein
MPEQVGDGFDVYAGLEPADPVRFLQQNSLNPWVFRSTGSPKRSTCRRAASIALPEQHFHLYGNSET